MTDQDALLQAIVKPLVWESGWFCGQDAFYSAHPAEGWSVVQFSSRNGRWAIDDPFGNASDDDWKTPTEAQVAAEADYRARLAAALNLEPVVALVRAASAVSSTNQGVALAPFWRALEDLDAALARLTPETAHDGGAQ